MIATTPTERRALAEWLRVNHPDILEFFQISKEYFGLAAEVSYEGEDESSLAEHMIAARSSYRAERAEELRRLRESIG